MTAPDRGDRTSRRIVDARLHLLSRQVLDADGEPVTTVDDLELVASDDGSRGVDDGPRDVVPGEPAEVGAILTERVRWSHVGHVGTVVELTVRADDLDLHWPEEWLREHVVGRIPGGRHDPEGDG